MNERNLTERQQRIYNLGTELANIADNMDVEPDSLITAWAQGNITMSISFDGVWWADRTESIIFDLGTKREEINFVDGWRYGNIPEKDFSYNYRDNCPEKGVSCMEAGGEKTENRLSALFISQNAPKVKVNGLLLPDKGSDGEPLLIMTQVRI